MRKVNFIILLLTSFISLTFITSCEKQEDPLLDIELPPAPLISESESWAVIEAAYLRLRERPETEAKLVTTLWKGYVLEVLSRSPSKVLMDDLEDYWYQVNYDGLQGWVFGSYLKIYESRETAETAARAVRAD